jgi:hypothetical protein
MAYRTFTNRNWTPTATADTTALANATYMAIKGGSGTQRIDIKEIKVTGLVNTSSPTLMEFARSSTLAITPTALAAPASDGPMDPATAALAAPPVTFTAAGTGGQRSALTTDARLDVGLNAWGGIMRWIADVGEQFSLLGNTTPFGEAYLSAFTGGTVGNVSAHIIYEPK